jgi:hypothetical protein
MKKMKSDGEFPDAEIFFEEPETFLDSIVKKHKGSTKAQWSDEARTWRKRDGFYWK